MLSYHVRCQLDGGEGADSLYPSGGPHNVLFGGNDTNADTFYLRRSGNTTSSTTMDMTPVSGDVISVSAFYAFFEWSAVESLLTEDATDTTMQLGEDNLLCIKSVLPNELSEANFSLAPLPSELVMMIIDKTLELEDISDFVLNEDGTKGCELRSEDSPTTGAPQIFASTPDITTEEPTTTSLPAALQELAAGGDVPTDWSPPPGQVVVLDCSSASDHGKRIIIHPNSTIAKVIGTDFADVIHTHVPKIWIEGLEASEGAYYNDLRSFHSDCVSCTIKGGTDPDYMQAAGGRHYLSGGNDKERRSGSVSRDTFVFLRTPGTTSHLEISEFSPDLWLNSSAESGFYPDILDLRAFPDVKTPSSITSRMTEKADGDIPITEIALDDEHTIEIRNITPARLLPRNFWMGQNVLSLMATNSVVIEKVNDDDPDDVDANCVVRLESMNESSCSQSQYPKVMSLPKDTVIDALTGSRAGGDILTGNSKGNILRGWGGGDFNETSGRDMLITGGGDDVLEGGYDGASTL
ncbi:unnamed protein product [Vitrella brassicaformis CCMP3155]|uniref:Calcium-binding protein n=3 Tax=Vitrella brassicaformis TaxID=1169539 RepID=A0A0G4EPU4_VITBC|nr:unnamed protein product [Vitrella brassicaformis CCMP3155]|eukprot:CEL99290.1 unnamed protein product [Vitrella brassicaformis CCMP3155]